MDLLNNITTEIIENMDFINITLDEDSRCICELDFEVKTESYGSFWIVSDIDLHYLSDKIEFDSFMFGFSNGDSTDMVLPQNLEDTIKKTIHQKLRP
jgi:hypothetical protein